jgi:hypothetical protein
MTLYCFGDSFTEGYKNDLKFPPYVNYKKSLGLEDSKDMPPIWSEILGEKLGIESFNYGKGGASNHETFLRFCNQSHNLKKNDIVIINWTYVQRCLWVIDESHENKRDNNLTSTSPHQGINYDIDGKFKNAYDIIAMNRMNFSWTFEVIGYEQIIDTLSKNIGFQVYYWFTDDYLFHNFFKLKKLKQRKYLIHDLIEEYNSEDYIHASMIFNILKQYGATTIWDESNGTADDIIHLGGNGHRIQAEIFYSYLTNTPYPNKLEKYL